MGRCLYVSLVFPLPLRIVSLALEGLKGRPRAARFANRSFLP